MRKNQGGRFLGRKDDKTSSKDVREPLETWIAGGKYHKRSKAVRWHFLKGLQGWLPNSACWSFNFSERTSPTPFEFNWLCVGIFWSNFKSGVRTQLKSATGASKFDKATDTVTVTRSRLEHLSRKIVIHSTGWEKVPACFCFAQTSRPAGWLKSVDKALTDSLFMLQWGINLWL